MPGRLVPETHDGVWRGLHLLPTVTLTAYSLQHAYPPAQEWWCDECNIQKREPCPDKPTAHVGFERSRRDLGLESTGSRAQET